MKRGALVLPALVSALGTGVAVALGAVTEAPPGVPIVIDPNPPPYVAPTGPPMSGAAAARMAVAVAQSSETQGGAASSRPTDLTQMRGKFAKTAAIASLKVLIPVSPETAPMLISDTYLTVMHGHFTSQNVPRGGQPAQGMVMEVITEAHTGEAEMTHIGQSAPTAGLAPVSLAEGGTASVARPLDHGVIDGRLVSSTGSGRHRQRLKIPVRPLVGWTVVVATGDARTLKTQASPQVVARLKTAANGRFTVVMRPGTYLVAGVWPPRGGPTAGHREVCGPRTVTVRRALYSHVVIACNG